MGWRDEKREKLSEDYASGRITAGEFDEMSRALEKLSPDKEQRNAIVISNSLIISVTMVLVMVSFFVYFFFYIDEPRSTVLASKNAPDLSRITAAAQNDHSNEPIVMMDMEFLRICREGFLPRVELAISYGANVNYESKGYYGAVTPLMAASNPEVIRALINAGANVNARIGDAEITPLMRAVMYGYSTEAIIALVDGGADVNGRNVQGTTPLMMAARNNLGDAIPEMITTLLYLGADPGVKDESGQRAIDLAYRNIKLKDTEALLKLEEMTFITKDNFGRNPPQFSNVQTDVNKTDENKIHTAMNATRLYI